MDRLSKNQLNCIGIISICIGTLMLILVIVLPIMLKNKKTNDFTQKCSPTVNNTNLWAKFPGDLNSTITHKYEIFNYKTNSQNNLGDSNEIEVKSDFTILENISYSNFKEDEKEENIYFNANRTYQYYNGNNKENEPINSINMGLFETFETMTYPPLYKTGINSIYYLLTRYFIDSDLFIKELFTYQLFNNLTTDIIKTKIFDNISDEKLEKILSTEEPYKKYSFKTYSGLFEWIKILNVNEDIRDADWLRVLFDLTDDEISYILKDTHSYLVSEYELYKIDIRQRYKCENDDLCGNELLYKQLINGSVISVEIPEIKDYLSLNKILETNYYPFDKSPEMKIFLEEELNTKDESYLPKKEQLESLLNTKSENCLLYPNNSIYLLYLNKTEYKKYLDLTLNQIYFLSQYFYDYLPKIFLYPKINTMNNNKNDTKDATVSVEPIAKTISTIFQEISDKIYQKFSKINLYKYLLVETIKDNLKEKIHFDKVDEICPLIFQKILDDGKKVNKICSDKNIGFNEERGLYEWVSPYYCFDEYKDEEKCNPAILNYLKELVYITDDEVNQIFSEDYLGGAIKNGLEAIKNAYQCGDKCEDNDYLLKLQIWKGYITFNAPAPLPKSNTIKSWFDDYLPYPIEISYYQEKYENNDEYTEEDIDFMISLVSNSDNKFDLKNSFSFANKLELEKKYSLYMNNNEKTSLIKLVDFLLDVFVYKENIYNFGGFDNKEKLIMEYKSVKNLLEGNDDDDKVWIDYLSSGNYFDNFKPNIEKTTGLDIGINLDSKKQENFDFGTYAINTTNGRYEKRRINQMNDLLTLNIKKQEYDYLQDKYINILSPTYDFEKLVGSRIYSDGFQYDHNLLVLYYYDSISSRPLRFKNPVEKKYKDKINCKRYELDEDFFPELNENFDQENKNALITQKLNKPFMISTDFDNLKKFNYVKEKVENYICVDTITDMVIESNINLIYSIYTRKYGYLNQNLKNEEIYPVFMYQRKYEVEVNSYEDQFPGVTEYYKNMTVFIIIGIIVIVICIVIAVLSFYLLKKKLKQDKKVSLKQSLVPLSDSEFKSNADTEAKEEEVINRNTDNNK